MTEISKITGADGVTVAPTGETDSQTQVTNNTGYVPMVQNNEPDMEKGVAVEAGDKAVQAGDGKPSFMVPLDSEKTFKGLNAKNTLLAQQRASSINRDLTRKYNEATAENPDIMGELDFPVFPTTGNPGFWTRFARQGMLSMQYMQDLDNYQIICSDMIDNAHKRMIVDEVRAVGAKVDDVSAKVDELKEMSAENLAATLCVGEAVLNGLAEVYTKIDKDTHLIISAVNSNGDVIFRKINKESGEIKDLILDESAAIKLTQIGTTDFITEFLGDKIDNLTETVKINALITNLNIISEGDKTREAVHAEGEATRENVHNEHLRTRSVVAPNRAFLDRLGLLPRFFPF